MVRHFVFGYASLVEQLRARPTREVRPGEGFVADLSGYRREWAVAMDNSRDLPGYKYYVERSTRSRPRVHVTFLDLEPDPSSDVNGVVYPVREDELPALDVRERNYSRRDVTARLSVPIEGRVWAYFGSAEARARLAQARSSGTAAVSRAYLDLVYAGFARLGAVEAARFSASTADPAVPVRELDRVDLPPA